MAFIEAPTTFYMGRRYDPTTTQMVDEVVYYDSRDLTTHAVVVGMTGSGKTGLCITLLEEAAMDNIPAIIIDPKGDITNLLLMFPNLSPDEFLPWINTDDANRAGLSPVEFATDEAQKWRQGLGSWGISPQRIQQLRQHMTYSIFTPGSDAGLAINIVDSLQPPSEGWAGYEEQHRERISGVVTALLTLTGKKVNSKDREHVLLSTLIEYAWINRLPLTLGDLIVQVQQPPFNTVGVFDVNTFFPEKERFKLAIELNNIIASPSFQTWLQGEALDMRSLLYFPDGRPRTSIFYIAHLNDAQRSFIITLILEAMLSWMRTLGGTSSLRALLYFDEVFGHFPPYPKNPPTKDPLLRLLKQARAFGLGTILATQNPGDLDYKGLSNAGTWFIGKLQTENDKRKVLDGLAAASSANQPINLAEMDQLLSTISPRVFVMNNVHDTGGPIVMHTRWAMSYLRGPMTRVQISQMMALQRGGGQARQQVPANPYGQPAPAQQYGYAQTPPPIPTGLPMQPNFTTPGAPPPPPTLPDLPPPPPSLPELGYAASPPPIPAGVGLPPQQQFTPPAPNYGIAPPPHLAQTPPAAPPPPPRPSNNLPAGYSTNVASLSSSTVQYYLPANIPYQQAQMYWEQHFRQPAGQVGQVLLAYQPFLLAQCEVRYMHRKLQLHTVEKYGYHVPNVQRSGLIHWEEFMAAPVDSRSLQNGPAGEAIFGELSPGLTDARRVKGLEKEIIDYLYRSAAISILANEQLGVYGVPGMPYQDLQAQVYAMAKEGRDAEIDKMTQAIEKQYNTLEDRYRQEERELEADSEAVKGLGRERLATLGEVAISLLQGRTTYTVSRLSRVGRYREQAKKDVTESEEVLADLNQQMQALQAQYQQNVNAIDAKWQRIMAAITEIRITPGKSDIQAELFGLAWKPFYYVVIAGRPEFLPAWQGQISHTPPPAMAPAAAPYGAPPPAPYYGGAPAAAAPYGAPPPAPYYGGAPAAAAPYGAPPPAPNPYGQGGGYPPAPQGPYGAPPPPPNPYGQGGGYPPAPQGPYGAPPPAPNPYGQGGGYPPAPPPNPYRPY